MRRKEIEKIRSEICHQKDEDKRLALAQLTKVKDLEIEASRVGWEQKMKDMINEVCKDIFIW